MIKCGPSLRFQGGQREGKNQPRGFFGDARRKYPAPKCVPTRERGDEVNKIAYFILQPVSWRGTSISFAGIMIGSPT
jgi:hypothetical protein